MKSREALLTLPSLLWLILLFLIPSLLITVISFKAVDVYGEIMKTWTLKAYGELNLGSYGPVIVRTLRLSILTTAICLLIGLPASYAMARMDWKSQQRCILLLILPFWTNFLIRIYAWKVILHPDGILKTALVFLGIVAPDTTLLYHEGTVLLVLVYAYLPFAVLPLYSAAAKFDFSLLEAGRDLGAGIWQQIFRIYLPGIRAGIVNAVLIVFIPALGSYVIPEIVGGPSSEMLGNKIAHRVFIDRNLPKAAALSSILLMFILLPTVISLFNRSGNRKEVELL
ncbi:MAG: ABC transporter permease [Spirochaetales bacterium]|nr:ABC transporter permease [Spirochaetales bacterium]